MPKVWTGELGDVTFRLPFLSIANKKRDFGFNRYRAAALASEVETAMREGSWHLFVEASIT
jgi:hypothetical protein